MNTLMSEWVELAELTGENNRRAGPGPNNGVLMISGNNQCPPPPSHLSPLTPSLVSPDPCHLCTGFTHSVGQSFCWKYKL